MSSYITLRARRAFGGMANGPGNQGGCLQCVYNKMNGLTTVFNIVVFGSQSRLFVELCIVKQVCSRL